MWSRAVRGILCGVALLACPALLRAGVPAVDTVGLRPVGDVPEFVSRLAPLIMPWKTIQDAVVLREYITGPEFAAARRGLGDRRAVDVLFREALAVSWNNAGEALFLCLVATVDHRRLGFDLPLLGRIFWLPLTGEFADEFVARTRALPSRLYADTPPEGDRDKLQHFFGSAFLTVVLESEVTAEEIGDMLEQGEQAFVVGGADDPRDRRANREGQKFGAALREDLTTLPSTYLGAGGDQPVRESP